MKTIKVNAAHFVSFDAQTSDSDGAATVSVSRVGSPVGSVEKFVVIVNEQRVAKIRHGEEITIEFAPGNYRLYVESPWSFSNTVEIDLKAHDSVHLIFSHATELNRRAVEICIVGGILIGFGLLNTSFLPVESAILGPFVAFCIYKLCEKGKILPSFLKYEYLLQRCDEND